MLLVNLWHAAPPQAHVWMEEEGWFESLMLALENRDPEVKDWLACLSRGKAEVLHDMILGRRPDLADKVLLVTSKTSKRKDVRACFKRPELFGTYRLVIASPSCGTGVSVEHVSQDKLGVLQQKLGVWKVWMHAQSGSGPNALDALQMLHRVRVPRGSWQIYCGGTGQTGPTDPLMAVRI